MKKIFKSRPIGIAIAFTFLILGCSNEKEILKNEVNDLKLNISVLEKQKTGLEEKVVTLQKELKTLKEDDHFFFNTGVELLDIAKSSGSTEEYLSAITNFRTVIQKFPQSVHVTKAKQYINSSNDAIQSINYVQDKKTSIQNDISSGNFEAASANLESIRGRISENSYKEYTSSIYEEKNKPVIIVVKDLVVSGLDYIGKRVTVTNAYIIGNEVSDGYFHVCNHNSSTAVKFDSDFCTQVFYRGMKNWKKWAELSSNPVISVTGQANTFGNQINTGYVTAESIDIVLE